ncbi:hypothetical protein ACLB2K_017100 [Fragaria x ananassa]
MDYLYITGAVIASLLSVVFLYTLPGKMKNVIASVKTQNGKLLKSYGNGMCLPAEIGTSPDIVIVGAGVVGSALAYTLGKVTFSNSCPKLCNSKPLSMLI